MGSDVESADYTEGYRAAMEELVEAEIAGREVVEATGGTGQVVDLADVVKASMVRLKPARRQGHGTRRTVHQGR